MEKSRNSLSDSPLHRPYGRKIVPAGLKAIPNQVFFMTLYQASDTDGEVLPVVDATDHVVGSAPRRRVHMEKLLHRAVHVVVEDGAGNLLLQHRSATKDSFPGWWDVSVGGHVDFGEDYDRAAAREISEELGITAPLREVARRPASAESGWEFIRIYTCQSRGPFHFPASEIQGTRWISVKELLLHGHSNPTPEDWRITPSGLITIHLWAKACGKATP